jgi:hypothetical protein
MCRLEIDRFAGVCVAREQHLEVVSPHFSCPDSVKLRSKFCIAGVHSTHNPSERQFFGVAFEKPALSCHNPVAERNATPALRKQ